MDCYKYLLTCGNYEKKTEVEAGTLHNFTDFKRLCF